MNKKSIVAFIIIAVIAIGGIIYALIAPSGTPKIVNTSPNSKQTSGQNATITYTNDGFQPSTLTVKKGTTVTVINTSTRDVEFSSGPHPIHNEDPEINLDVLKPGQKGSFVAKTTGTHGFHDHIHDDITGTLIVTN
jgi:plastocyanin